MIFCGPVTLCRYARFTLAAFEYLLRKLRGSGRLKSRSRASIIWIWKKIVVFTIRSIYILHHSVKLFLKKVHKTNHVTLNLKTVASI